MNKEKNMTIEEEFFNKLYYVLEKKFPKGEKCECGKKLPCRSKAIVLNAYANIFFKEMKEKWQSELRKEILQELRENIKEKKRQRKHISDNGIDMGGYDDRELGYFEVYDEILEILKTK